MDRSMGMLLGEEEIFGDVVYFKHAGTGKKKERK